MKTCLWLIFLLFTSCSLLAQRFPSRNLSLQQGLPEYYVSGIVQDQAGFIWVATRDGLARYDGRAFTVFRHQPFGKPALGNNIIASLQAVSDTTLLIQLGNSGFQRFNPLTEQFTDLLTPTELQHSHLDLSQATLTPDNQHVWGRHEAQLIHVDPRTKQFQAYAFPPYPNPRHQYPGKTYWLDAVEHQVYAPFPGQLVQFDTRTKTFRSWAHPLVGFPGPVETYYGTPIVRRVNGEIILGAAQQLLLFNPRTHRFHSIPIPSPVHTQVGLLYQAPDGNVYFTHAMTLYRLSPDDRLTPLWTAPRIDYQNYFHALLLDRSGVLWIGTNGDGLYQLDLRALPIKTYPYRTNFAYDVLTSERHLSVPAWLKTDNHLYRLRFGGTAPFVTIGLDDAYYLLQPDPNDHSLQPVLTVPRSQSFVSGHESNAVRVTPDGTVWMYSPFHGLLKADSTGHLLERFRCSINWVSAVCPLGEQVWLASEGDGLYAYDTRQRRFTRHLRYQPTDSTALPSNQVLSMAPDPTNPALLWVGTQEGLCRLDTRTMRCRNWTSELPSPTINTLLADRRGQLWFSTLKGISRLDPRTGQMRHFSTADGLSDIEYRQNHGLQLPDGRLAFGGATGLTVFDPLALQERAQPMSTVLTGLRIANKPVEPGPSGSPLTLPINATPTLRLSYSQNFISLEYAGLQFNKPASLRYRYQLTGVDADWVYVGNHTVANYTQLAPGDYEFRVNTADAAGHWSPLVKTIRISIAPPWWQTGWAYGLYGLLVAGLVRAYIRYRINRAQLRQEVVLKEQEARLIQENADWQTRFFTNITHEFRTPLTLIINPLERLMEPATKLSRDSLGQQLGVIYRNAQRLLRLINQLLDLAKLEAGQLPLTESQGNLPAFFADLVDSFQPRAQKKGVQLVYESAGLTADYQFDAPKLETIGYNLLANAINFTDSGGHVQVSLSEENRPDGQSGFGLRVADTGCGIAAEQLPRIFDRFFQGFTAGASTARGTGIGLFLVAEFAKLLDGSVTVESQLGQGTTFSVSLPLQQADGSEPVVESLSSEAVVYPESAVAPSVAPATAPLMLVVEDNDELRAFIAGELAGAYRVLTAENGEVGWKLCLAELPELVISDVMMPQVDGFTLVERIKTTPLTAHIAVMLLTARTMTDARIQGLSAGANDYLTKPFNVRELQLRIRNLLHHQQKLRQHWQQQMSQLSGANAPVRLPATDDPFLLRFYAVLEDELTNTTFGIEQLADELAVSARTLHRKLSALTGANANELMRLYRLQKAAGFLQQGRSVAQAAEQAGFEGLSYFAKTFKAQFGVSPSAYQRAQKN